MTQTNNTYQQSIELVERFAQCLIKDYKNKADIELVKQLAPYIKYFNTEIQMSIKKDQIFKNFLNMIDVATEKPDCDSVLKEFQKEIQDAEKQLMSSEKCQKYIDFMEMLSNIEGEDEEIKTVTETISTIDPISKLPIVDPVKNKICGHSYEKSTILQLIGRNPKTKCPIPGCNATEFVKRSHLIPDAALKRMLSSTSSNSEKKIKLDE